MTDTPANVQAAGEAVLRHHVTEYVLARDAVPTAIDAAMNEFLVPQADVWRICEEAGLDEAGVLQLIERPGPSLCVCGALRVQHPRRGKSTVAGSTCGKFEAAK